MSRAILERHLKAPTWGQVIGRREAALCENLFFEESCAGMGRATDEPSPLGLISAVATRWGIPQAAGVEAAEGIEAG